MIFTNFRSRSVACATAMLAALLSSGACAQTPVAITPSVSPGPADGPAPLYLDPKATLEDRVNDLFARLTQNEKLGMMSGTGFTTQPIARLGVPAMSMSDAGEGVRGGMGSTQGPATEFPCGVMMASTWDPEIVGEVAHAIGVEALNKGTGSQVLLGPDVNIHRSPLNGRDGESFTEDPYLNAKLAVAFIKGVQSSGAAGCIIHYIANNEEGDRNTVDVQVSERALREIYMPAFKAAVQDGHAWAAMASYNRINGFYATANSYLINTVFKSQWSFDGLMMSDWGADHETIGAVNAGTDLEMPGGQYETAAQLAPALAAGKITQAQIDDSVKRILRTIIRVGLLDGPAHTPDPSLVNSKEHADIAYKAETDGIILLKNSKDVLPLDLTKVKTIAVIGPAGKNGIQGCADGSPSVTPVAQTTIYDSLVSRLGSAYKVTYTPGVELPGNRPVPITHVTSDGNSGWNVELYTSPDISGPILATIPDQPNASIGRDTDLSTQVNGSIAHSIAWFGTVVPTISGSYQLVEQTNLPCRILVDGKAIVDNSAGDGNWMHSCTITLTAGTAYQIEVELLATDTNPRGRFGWILPGQNGIDDAVAAAKASDYAIVCVTTHGQDGEGRDRPTFSLPGDQDALIQAVAAVNKHTIVILNSGSPVDMTQWIKSVPGVLDIGFPGQEGGRAVAAVLTGDVNPSGKTADTFGKRREDYADYGNFPGGKDGKVHYAEGIYIGYRHFDKAGITPLFPFGYGLSYTKFSYSNIKLSSTSINPTDTLTVTCDITNTGSREGSEVAELYVSDLEPKIDRPIRELKGFTKLDLLPRQTKTATFTLTPQDLAYYDEKGATWLAQPGAYDIEVGASSRDIKCSKQLTLLDVYIAKP